MSSFSPFFQFNNFLSLLPRVCLQLSDIVEHLSISPSASLSSMYDIDLTSAINYRLFFFQCEVSYRLSCTYGYQKQLPKSWYYFVKKFSTVLSRPPTDQGLIMQHLLQLLVQCILVQPYKCYRTSPRHKKLYLYLFFYSKKSLN